MTSRKKDGRAHGQIDLSHMTYVVNFWSDDWISITEVKVFGYRALCDLLEKWDSQVRIMRSGLPIDGMSWASATEVTIRTIERAEKENA